MFPIKDDQPRYSTPYVNTFLIVLNILIFFYQWTLGPRVGEAFARIYGEVLGYATTNDAFHQVAPDETGEAPAKAISLALQDAGLQPADVDYVNAHGTSTQLNDAGETKALKIALGEYAYKVPISSTKSMIGHLLGAAGAVEAIATLLTINRGMIHPTINYENPDPECDLDYVPNQARRKDVRIAISNGFGFGGHNAVVVLGKYQE